MMFRKSQLIMLFSSAVSFILIITTSVIARIGTMFDNNIANRLTSIILEGRVVLFGAGIAIILLILNIHSSIQNWIENNLNEIRARMIVGASKKQIIKETTLCYLAITSTCFLFGYILTLFYKVLFSFSYLEASNSILVLVVSFGGYIIISLIIGYLNIARILRRSIIKVSVKL